jgi:hypothetical protein
MAAAALGFLPSLASAQPAVPPGTPITITVQPAAPATPPVSITLLQRHGHVTPLHVGCNHTGGGTIDVVQPGSDTIIITMTGAAVSYCGPRMGTAGLDFDLNQILEVSFDNPKVKKAKMTIEGRVIGLLRSHVKGGTAQYSQACATVSGGAPAALTLTVPDHCVGNGENLSVNDHEGPHSMPVVPGKYSLHQTFSVLAQSPCCAFPHKAPSAEFAPDPALDPLWISVREPFHGAAKKDFGFQVILKVAEE